MHGYLFRFLTSPDATFQHIAVWTIVQLLESGGSSSPNCDENVLDILFIFFIDPQLISNIKSSEKLMTYIRDLSTSRSVSPASSVGTPRSRRSQTQSYQETDTEGAGEIQVLARKILEIVEADTPSAEKLSHTPSNHSVDKAEDELRRSVRDAFRSHSPR